MILIYAIMNDHTRTLLTTTRDLNFDVQSWANSRIEAFKILGIIEIYYEVIE